MSWPQSGGSAGFTTEPVSADQPCGPDLSNDPRFDALEALLKGKPEVEMGSVVKPAEPPDWGQLKTQSLDYLGRSKHLRVAVMLSASLLKTAGVAGFVDGLQLIRGLLEQHWTAVYPRLDPEDNNDPTQRLNTLGALTASRGSMGLGWLAILDYLYTAPICRPKGAPPVSFDDLTASKQKAAGAEGAPAIAPDPAKLMGAMREAGDQVASHHQSLQQALEAAQAIDKFLTATLTAGNTISFDGLEKSLKEMIEGLNPYLPGGAGESGAELHAGAGGAAGASTTAGASGIPVTGSIRSREHVVQAIESICDYYRQVEPCSPVPYLLRRAQKLARMDFVEAVQELQIASIDSLRPSMGSAVEPPPPSP